MSGYDSDPSKPVTVVCPVCGARIHATARTEPGDVECPDCFTMVSVPALKSTPAPTVRPVKPERDDSETYSLEPEPEGSHREKPAETVTVQLACPSCGANMTAAVERKSKLITCAECLEVLTVPPQDELRKKRKRKRPKLSSVRESEPDGSREGRSHLDPSDAMAEIRRDPPPPIPKWTFFTRVFTLPWHQDVLSRWNYTSLGWTLLGLLVATVHWVIMNGYLVAVPCFSLPAIVLVLWTGSYAVSSALTVLEGTAAGNDVIPYWNDGGWGDWLGDSYGPVFLAAATSTVSFAIAKFAVGGNAAVYWPVFLGTFVFLLPIVLLSALQAGSYSVPITGTVLKTLITKLWAWLLFYVLAGVVAAVYFGLVAVGLYSGRWFLTLIFTGPLLASVMLIEARLMGRLAWRVIVVPSESAEETPKRKKRKRDADKTGNSQHRIRKLSRKLTL